MPLPIQPGKRLQPASKKPPGGKQARGLVDSKPAKSSVSGAKTKTSPPRPSHAPRDPGTSTSPPPPPRRGATRLPVEKGPAAAPPRDAEKAAKPRAAEPPVCVWTRPDWDRTEYLEDRRPAGVFVLQNRRTRAVYWGTGWDLSTVRKEQMDLIALGIHPDKRLTEPLPDNGRDEKEERMRQVEFIVVRELPLPPTFALGEFEAQLGLVLGAEKERYRRSFTERLVQLYKFSRLRCALRGWWGRARLAWLREYTSCAIEVQRWLRAFLARRRVQRLRARLKMDKAAATLAQWCQRYYRGQRDRAKVSKALEYALQKRRKKEVGSQLGQVVRDPKTDGVLYKIHRLQYLEKKKKNEKRPAAAKPASSQQPKKMPVPLLVNPATVQQQASTSRRTRRLGRAGKGGGGTGHEEGKAEDAATTLRCLRTQAMPQVIRIQRYWRGYQARLYVKSIYKSLRNRRIRRERAASTIQDWYRRSVLMHKAMDYLLDLRYERECCLRTQRIWRGYRARKGFKCEFGETIRQRQGGALVAQRLARGFLARHHAKRMKNKVFLFRMAVRVAQFFRRAQASLAGIRGTILRKRNAAATHIQKRVRVMLAKRRVVRQREHRRREAAAQRIQMAWHRHRYRRRQRSRYCLQVVGACDMCVSARAVVYVEFTEQKLCESCHWRTLEIVRAKGLTLEGRTYVVKDYRRASAAVGVIQQAWRKSMAYKTVRFGPCVLCGHKAVRLYCLSCKYRTCRSCSAAVHLVSVLRHHKPIAIEVLLRQKQAAAVICLFFKENFERFKLEKRFGNNYRARRVHAATLMQSLMRGHYTRRVFALYSYAARSLALLNARRRRPYPLWASYPLAMDRATRFLDPGLCPHLVNIRSTLGLGPLTRVVRKRAALSIETMLVHRREYVHALKIVGKRRQAHHARLRDQHREREEAIMRRVAASIIVQKVFRGYSSRLQYSANMKARLMARRLVTQLCDVPTLWRRCQALWSLHRGYLGCIRLGAHDIMRALGQAGFAAFPLSDAGDGQSLLQLQPLQHALVGGQLRVAFSIQPNLCLPHTVVPSRLAAPGTTATSPLPEQLPSFCVHASQSSAPLPQAPPSVLKVQLAGVCELQPGGVPHLTSMARYACKLSLWGEPACSSSRSVPVKLEPSFHDEVLYVSLLGSQPRIDLPALRIDVFSVDRSSGLPVYPGRPIGSLPLSATELLRLLGRNACLPLQEVEGGKSFCLSLLLSLESPQRTESRLAAISAVRHVMRLLRAELDFRTPRIELRLLHALIPEPGPSLDRLFDADVYHSFCLQIEWSADGSSVRTPHVPFAHKLLWPAGAEATSLTLGVPDNYPEDEWQVKVTLAAHTSVADDVVLAVGRLGCRDLFQPEGAGQRWVSLREPCISVEEDGSAIMGPVPEDGPVLARVCFSVATPFVKRPRWRRRLDAVEEAVPRLIKQALALVPQPRVELRVNELSEVTSRAKDLTIDVYWGQRHITRLRERRRAYPDATPATSSSLASTKAALPTNGQEVKKATVAFSGRGGRICLFFPEGHQWRQDAPDLRLVVRGTLHRPGDTYLGEARLLRHEVLLQPSAQSAQLPLFEPLDPAEHGVYRKMTGLLSCSFTPADVPASAYPQLRLPHPRLCLHFLDVRHDLQANHAAHLMQGLHCRLMWKGVEVARTLRVQSPSHPRWTDEVFSLPIRHESEHPTNNPTQPLFLQLFRRAVDRRGHSRDELVGEVVPFNGKARSIPTSYYPFDIYSALGGKREGRVIGQLGLGLWVDYLDVDKDRTMDIITQTLEPGDGIDEDDEEEESKRPTAGDVHLMATMAVRHERKRRYSQISALAKTEQEALDVYRRAREVAGKNPGDRPLQQYVRLLQAEYERANRALKNAKLKGEEALAKGSAAPVVVDLFEGVVTTRPDRSAGAGGDHGDGEGRGAAVGGLGTTTKPPQHSKRKPALKTAGAKADPAHTIKTTPPRDRGGHKGTVASPAAVDAAHATTRQQLAKTSKQQQMASTRSPQASSTSRSPGTKDGSASQPDVQAASPASSTDPSGVRFALPGAGEEEEEEDAPPLSPADRAKALLTDARLSPPVPVLEPSAYLVIKRAVGVGVVLGSAPFVHVLWCGRRVATTQAGTAVTKQPGVFTWQDECFLLPLPPLIDKAALQLEVWGGQEFCGQVLVEGRELPQELVSVAAAQAGQLEVEHQLMPREYSGEVENHFGRLLFYVVQLTPAVYEPVGEEMVEYVGRVMDEAAKQGEEAAAFAKPAAVGDEGLAAAPANSSSKTQLSEAQLRFVGGTYLRCKYVVKLQVLAGSHLPKTWGGMDETDPFVVLLLNGREVGRSVAMDNTMDPIFRSGESAFDLPVEVAAETDEAKHRLVLQLYDSNSVASNELLGTVDLGPSDLRRLMGRAEPLLLKLTKPRKANNSSKAEEPVPSLTVAVHVLPRPPRQSRIEMRIMGLQHAGLSSIAGGKAAVQVEVSWNDSIVASLNGDLQPQSGRTSLSQSIVDLPFICQDPFSQQRRFAETPSSLRVDVYQVGVSGGDQRKFLGQLTACGPFGLPVEEQDGNLLGSEYNTVTYRLTPRPEMLISPTAEGGQGRKSAAASPLDAVGGYMTCQFVLCDPTPSAVAWLDSVRSQQDRGPRTRLRLLDAVNLADVAGALKGRSLPSASVAVYFNNRLVHRSAVQPATSFPVWDEDVDLPLHGHSQSQFRDHVALEVLHDNTLLGCVSLSAKELYEPVAGLRVDHRLQMPPFGAGLRGKQHRVAQGSLSLTLQPLAPGSSSSSSADAAARRRQSSAVSLAAATVTTPVQQQEPPDGAVDNTVQDGGFRPRRWIRLKLSRARNLRKTDLLGKSDPYCLVLWNRRTQLRTTVAWKTVHPVWNQTLDLRYDEDDVRLMGGELELRVLVLDKEVIGGVDPFLGQLVFTGRQLLEATGRAEALALQPRPDVAEDHDLAGKLRASTLHLSLRAMEEVPFVQMLSAMQLRLPGSYLALDVVALDAQAGLEEEEDEGKTQQRPAFFVQLVRGDQTTIARTACAPFSRGEARFQGEHYIFPVSDDGSGASSSSSSHAAALSRLERHDLTKGLKLEVFGLFPNEAHATTLLGPSLRKLGHLRLGLQDFIEPPLYQTRQPLEQDATPPPVAFGRRETTAARYARAKLHLSLRLACLRPSPPRAFRRPLSGDRTMPRLRLQVMAVVFDPLGEEGSDESGSMLEPPQWPRPGALYHVDLGFRQGTTAPVRSQVPLLHKQQDGQHELPPGVHEYLLDLPPDGRLREARLAMSVTQEAPAMVMEGMDGRSVQFEAKTEELGEVCLGWDVLSTLPVLCTGYAVSDLELGDEKLPVVARRLSRAAMPPSAAGGDAVAPQLFESRLVYRQTHADLTAGGAAQTSNRVSGFRLVYGLRLELVTLTGPQDGAGPAACWDDEAPLCLPSKHVTQQGFDCADVGRTLHREEQEDDEATLLSSSYRRRQQLRSLLPGEAAPLRRLRLAVTQVYAKRSGPAHQRMLVPIQAGCLVTWRGQVMSTLVVSASQLSKAERDSTCYLPLGGDGEVHDLSIIVIAQPGGDGASAAAGDEEEEEVGGGVAYLPWDRLRRLPWNRTDYVVTSGDEQLCDSAAYVSLQLETLRDTPQGDDGGGGLQHVRELGELVVCVKLCLETSRPSRPFMLELQPLRAEALALCNDWGAARLPGRRQRRVYATVKHGRTLWHTTKAVLGEENGEVDLAGPMAALPLLHDAAELTVSLHDLGHFTPREVALVVRVQKLVRCWVARRRVALLRVKKRRRWQQWRAATSIACAARRWVQAQRRVKAVLVLQRAMRGLMQRRRIRTLVRTSMLVVSLQDLRYVTVDDDSLDGLVPVHCVVAWNGKTVASYDLDVTLRDGCDLRPLAMPLACVLKRVLHDERLLCRTVAGREYYVVDRARLSITLVRRAMAFAYPPSLDWHVARLALDERDLARLCQVVPGGDRPSLKTCFTLSFRTVQGGDGVSRDDIVRRASLITADRLLQPPPRTSCPNLLVLGLSLEAQRPLWDHGRSPEDSTPPQSTPESEESPAAAVLDHVLGRAMLLARSKMLTMRIAGFRNLPRMTAGGGGPGKRDKADTASSLSPSCLVTWEGATLATIKLVYQEGSSMWTPSPDQPPSQPSGPTASSRSDVFVPLPRPSSANPQVLLLLYHEGLHGKVLLATGTLGLDDLLELRRTGARQVAGRGAWASSLVEVVLDPSEARGREGSTSRLSCVDVGVYFTAPATAGSEGGRRSSLSSTTATQRRTSALRDTGAAATTQSLGLSTVRRKSLKSGAVEEEAEQSMALVLVAPAHEDHDEDEEGQEEDSSRVKKQPEGEEADGGSIWATAGGTAVNVSIMGSVSSSRRPAKLDFDEERQLYYFVNDKGNRVYQIPKRALAPPPPPPSAP